MPTAALDRWYDDLKSHALHDGTFEHRVRMQEQRLVMPRAQSANHAEAA